MILCIAIFFLSSYAWGADWVFLRKNSEGADMYYDKDSIHYPYTYVEKGWLGATKKKIDKYRVGFWIKWVKMPGAKEGKMLITIYCSSRKFRTDEIVEDGETETPTANLLNVTPDSIIEDLYKIICKIIFSSAVFQTSFLFAHYMMNENSL